MHQGHVQYDLDGGIGLLTLNNPERRNALSSEVLTALKGHLSRIGKDCRVRALVLRAAGAVFSSGHDLRELASGGREDHIYLLRLCTDVMESIRLLPQPVIAQVQGLATAAGCQLAASCDLIVASDNAAFATPGVKLGLFCTTPGVALSRTVLPKPAMEMLLTGAPVSAEAALRFGLVNRVVPAERLEEETMALAQQIASFSPQVVALGKAAFYRQLDMDWPEAYEFTQGVMVENLALQDSHEGIDAFLSKRQPRWSGS